MAARRPRRRYPDPMAGRVRIALGLGLGLLVLTAGSASAAGPPSFVHVLTDDQTVDSLRHMPHTRRLLARQGTKFTNYHTVQPLCCPSRASFLTGQYPHNHGVLSNVGPQGGFGRLDFSRTLYTALHDAGYRTGWIGKVLNTARLDEALEPEPGFDEWLVPLRNSQHEMTNFAVSDNGVERQITGVHQNPFLSERALRFLRADTRRPFLLTLAFFSPHWTLCPGTRSRRCPPTPAPQDVGSFAGERFPFGADFPKRKGLRRNANRYWRSELESLQSVDRAVRRLVVELRRQGRLDDTYVVFQSDNGHLHGQRGIAIEKNLPWDRSVRVPMLIRGPGLEGGRKRSDLAANVDLPATILDAAAIPPPLAADGRSLLAEGRRKMLILERPLGNEWRWWSRPWTQIKTAAGWTYWEWGEGGRRPELYNLRRDPLQTRNRVRARPGKARKLSARMSRQAGCAAPCP
jgi:N-acetylglucosamine-6-sulfatase